ncbi:SpoIIAA family protein [Caenimonas soli]|uniref:STAS/SEC14 domain-containing protein n=1 Tax=Caenimonas soli TaxID=2735555 RepID=UPI001553CAF1|nr:STAS/SEC14 domain-containing protein [Caenimonas soli]NPC58100.1 hypothetical protein [Caenimonas soli]
MISSRKSRGRPSATTTIDDGRNRQINLNYALAPTLAIHRQQLMLQVSILSQDGPVIARLAGLVSLEAWDQALRELNAAISGSRSDRLLVDLGGLVGWLGVPERKAVGALMATHLAQMRKVALVIQAEKITGVVQAEAQKGGLDLRLFSSRDDAMSWVVS